MTMRRKAQKKIRWKMSRTQQNRTRPLISSSGRGSTYLNIFMKALASTLITLSDENQHTAGECSSYVSYNEFLDVVNKFQ